MTTTAFTEPDPMEPPGPFPHRPADRQDRLNDAVLSVRSLGRYEYAARRLPAGADHALVLTTTANLYRAYLPPRRPSRSDIASGRFTAMYEVDTGVQRFGRRLELPSDDRSFAFDARADFEWQVRDPVAYVVSGERNVPDLLVGALRRAVHPVTATHWVRHAEEAEAAARAALEEAGPFGAEQGLRVRCDLWLSVDAQTRAHATARRDQYDAYERAEIDEQQEAVLRTYLDKKVAYYQQYLNRGEVTAWALHLAEHPTDTQLAFESLSEQQIELIRSQYEVVKELLRSDKLEAYELETPKQLLFRFIEGAFSQSLPPGLAPLPALDVTDASADRPGTESAEAPRRDADGFFPDDRPEPDRPDTYRD
ncbi:hypothetical protein ACFYVL_29525 [Streptomyces sp. NPDC004111]|uniref:hypothetical protein n=1 Tax=Streptomyces sp. NPDC004111 TaxID=3364690 RepID=UPI003686A98D